VVRPELPNAPHGRQLAAPTQSNTTGNATVVGNTAYGTATTTTYGGQTLLIAGIIPAM
jgi:hypothetical protein